MVRSEFLAANGYVVLAINYRGSAGRGNAYQKAIHADWGNLESQPDTARVSSLNDFYRARFLYRLSHGGEAVEAGLTVFFQTLYRRAELQTVALEDITSRLLALRQLVDDTTSPDGPDVAKMHEVLRDLVRVFEDLAENAQAFMAGVARSLELHPRTGLSRNTQGGGQDSLRCHRPQRRRRLFVVDHRAG